MRAIWNDTVVAECEETIEIDGHHYFPPDSVRTELLTPSASRTTSAWMGTASFYTLTVDGQANIDAAWSYPEPLASARQIADYVAFASGVVVEP